jgi:hypothetical protein
MGNKGVVSRYNMGTTCLVEDWPGAHFLKCRNATFSQCVLKLSESFHLRLSSRLDGSCQSPVTQPLDT